MKMPLSCSFPPQRMSVTADQVHVWHAPLDISQSEVTGLEETFAPEELSRGAQW
jgi:hypothetical protein